MFGERARRRRIATLVIAALLLGSASDGALAATICPPPPDVVVPGAVAAAATTAQAPQRAQRRAQAKRTVAQAQTQRADKAARRAAARRHRAAVRKHRAAVRAHRAALRDARKIRLVLEDPGATISFAGERGTLDVPVVIKTTRPIPRAIKTSDLQLEALRDLHRVGDNLPSVSRAVALMSAPRISRSRDRVYFSVCVDGDRLHAGSYTGAVTVSGPTRFAHVDVPVTVTVKDAAFFSQGVAVALLIAGVFLLYKELRNDSKIRFADWNERQPAPEGGADPNWTRFKRHWSFFFSLQSHFGVDFFLLELCVPIAAAFAAVYGIYASTPTWGEAGVTQWFSLITTAFTAAGVRSLIVAATPEPRLPRLLTDEADGEGTTPDQGSRPPPTGAGAVTRRSPPRSGPAAPAARAAAARRAR